MTTELRYLVWTMLLALFQIFLAAQFRTKETGLAYNASPRDAPPQSPPGLITARLMRAQSNLFETLPIFIGAVLLAHSVQPDLALASLGAAIYFWSRLVYIPLYAFGIPYLRSVTWLCSVAGLVTVIYSTLRMTW